MSDEVVKALIAAGVSVTVAIVGLVGIWLGRKPMEERRKPPTEEERRNDPVLIGLVNQLIDKQIQGYERQLTDLAGKVKQLETQRDEREKRIDELEGENRELRERVEKQEDEIANLKTQIELMKDRETKRNG